MSTFKKIVRESASVHSYFLRKIICQITQTPAPRSCMIL